LSPQSYILWFHCHQKHPVTTADYTNCKCSKCLYDVTCVGHQMYGLWIFIHSILHKASKFQDVTVLAILSKNFYITICTIINHYATNSTLIYIHGCKQELCVTYVLSYCTNANKVMCHITSQTRDIHKVLTYLQHVHDKTTKQIQQLILTYGTWLFEMNVGVLPACRTQYTRDSSICIFLFNRKKLQVFVTYLTGALYVHPSWFYKHQHNNRVHSKLFVACHHTTI
jgi:hypothetical protein